MVKRLYKKLKIRFPHINHGWWPVSGKFMPKEFEICAGAVLAQNTSWKNVEKALGSLVQNGLATAESIAGCRLQKLEKAVKSSGFYRQKAKRLKALCRLIINHEDFYSSVTREELLAVKGIGRETADSILLYACGRPYFVIDAYTRRLLSRLGMINGAESYEELRRMFEKKLPKDACLYREFHAMIVENEKNNRKGAGSARRPGLS